MVEGSQFGYVCRNCFALLLVAYNLQSGKITQRLGQTKITQSGGMSMDIDIVLPFFMPCL